VRPEKGLCALEHAWRAAGRARPNVRAWLDAGREGVRARGDWALNGGIHLLDEACAGCDRVCVRGGGRRGGLEQGRMGVEQGRVRTGGGGGCVLLLADLGGPGCA